LYVYLKQPTSKCICWTSCSMQICSKDNTWLPSGVVHRNGNERQCIV